MDQEISFSKNYEAQNIAFLKANLLNIVTHYVTTSYNKTAHCILLLSGSAYIQEFITIAHLRYCHILL